MTDGAGHAEPPSAEFIEAMPPPHQQDPSGRLPVVPNLNLPGGHAQTGAFDRLTRLAVRLLRVPIALVSLREGESEAILSHVGLPEPWASRRQNPLYEPERWQAISRGDVVVVASSNDLAHPLGRDRQVTRGLEDGAYLAAPLITTEGAVVGCLGVIDTQPRAWTDDEVDSLKDLAASVVMEIELRAVIEEQRRDEQAQRFLDELGTYMRSQDDPDELLWTVVQRVGEYLNVSRCLFSETDFQQGRITVLRDYHRGVPSFQGVYPGSSFSSATGNAVRDGRTVVVEDAQTDERTAGYYASRYGPGEARAYVSIPLMRDGQCVSTFWVSDQQPRHWTPRELALLHNVAERAWLAAEKLRAEAARRESAANYRALSEAIPAVIFSTTPDGHCDYLNQQWLDYTGQTSEAALGYGWTAAIHPDDQSGTLDKWHQAVRDGVVFEVEYRLRRASGEYYWFLGRAAPLRDAQGHVVRWLGVATDIHDRKMAEETHRFVSHLFEETRDIDDPEEVTTFVARQLGQRLNLDRANFSDVDLERDAIVVYGSFSRDIPSISGAHHISDYSPQTTQEMRAGRTVVVHNTGADPRTRAVYEQVYRPESIGAYIAVPLLRNGRWSYTLSVSTRTPRRWSDEDVRLIEGVAERTWLIVERRRAEQALRESEALLRSYYTSAPVHMGLVELLDDGDILHLYDNPATCRFFGLEEGGTAGRRASEIGASTATIQLWRRHYLASQIKGGVVEFEYEHDAPDGTQWLSVAVSPVVAPAPRSTHFCYVSQDITERKQVEEALRESEQHLRHVIDGLFAFVGVMTPDGILIEANRTALQAANLTPADVLGKPFEQTYWWAWSPDVQAQLRAAIQRGAQGERSRYDVVVRLTDDHFITIDFMLAPLFDERGGVTYLVPSGIDISERKQVEEALRESRERATRSLAELEATYQSAPVGLCVFDRDLRWVRINQVLAEINGHPVEAHLGRRICDISPSLAAMVDPILERILATGKPVVNLEVTGANATNPDTVRTVLASWFPMYAEDGQITGINAVVQDISDRKRAEAERERLLQREKAAREEAESANRAKDEFLAVASHELRTPLTAILGWASALRSGRLKGDTATRAVQVIEQNAQVQAQLIEDILDFSRIITGKLNFKADLVDLNTVVQAAVDSVRLAAAAKDIQIRLQQPAGITPVLGDSDRLQQVAWNLLTNGVKFTPQGGQMFIELMVIEGMAQLSVRDTGVGISADFLPYVFDRFRQADSSSTRKYGGLGLGLAIVRHIVEAHGGTVHAASPGVDRGATFTVRLPLEVEEQDDTANNATSSGAMWSRTPAEHSPCPPSLVGQRILVVEDEAHTRELIATVLEGCGVEVRSCASVSEALAVVAAWWPNVLISDIGMPEEDGYSLIRKLRALQAKEQRELTALALTAYARSQDRQRALAAGYDVFLAKPIEPDDLLQRLAALVPN